MDENKIAGSAKQAGGKAISDAKLQSDGDDDKTPGKIRNAVGGAVGAIRDALKTP
jgi:uncharacterized protein YjbJ (UPF0337 family)